MGVSQNFLWSLHIPDVGWGEAAGREQALLGSRKEGGNSQDPSQGPQGWGVRFSENLGLSSDPQVVVRVPSQHHGA